MFGFGSFEGLLFDEVRIKTGEDNIINPDLLVELKEVIDNL